MKCYNKTRESWLAFSIDCVYILQACIVQLDCVMQITVNKNCYWRLIFLADQRSFHILINLSPINMRWFIHSAACQGAEKLHERIFFHCKFPVNREISQFFTSRLPKTMRQRPVIDSTSVFFAIVVVKNTNNSLSSSVTRAIYGFSAFPFSSCLSLPMNYRAWFWHIAKLQQFNFWCDFRILSQRIKQKILKNQSLDDDDDDIDREKMHEHNRNLIESLNIHPFAAHCHTF